MFYIGKAVKLTDGDFARIASGFNIEEALVRAVNEVEANGKGFQTSGAVTALYEPHWAYKQSSGSVRAALVKAGIAYPKWGQKPYPKSPYPNIDMCAKIGGEELAALSTSWGLGQLMGFNHDDAGFSTAVSMVKSFAESEANQLIGMMHFIEANPAMMKALTEKNWAEFARRYNGAGYAKNKYDTKLAASYKKWSAKQKPVLPPEPVVEAPVKPAVIVPPTVGVPAKPSNKTGWISLAAIAASGIAAYFGWGH